MVSRSAGGVIIGNSDRIVIVNQNHDSWSLPKGRIEEGEISIQAAIREIYEESGISDLKLIAKLGSYKRPTIKKGGTGDDWSRMKQITFYLFSTKQKDLQPFDPHNPEARWVNIDEAVNLLFHKLDKKFLIDNKQRILLAISEL